ncbi:MAG: hypothetical protein II126_04605 [Erysipelotrichaceae bacterium]|nr:hypothetical protein [Erysipelotrichaceae bacterium]
MFKLFRREDKLKRILEKAREKRSENSDEHEVVNVLFLDFDGVINIPLKPGRPLGFDRECMENICRLCHRFDLKIVVISSWKRGSSYRQILYDQGLDGDIEVIGKTDDLPGPREKEVMKYLTDNVFIDKFIIIDDGFFNELSPYQIKTSFANGFDLSRYREAEKLLEKQAENR